MEAFPLFIDLEHKKCMIAGGGKVAIRKVRTLMKYQADIHVISKDFCEEFDEISQNTNVSLHRRSIETKDLEGSFLVIAATDDRQTNHEIYTYCEKNHIYVNVADAKEECNFFFPAVVKEGPVSIGISSSGNSPVLTSAIRKEIEKIVPSDYDKITQVLGQYRRQLKEVVEDDKERGNIMRYLTKWALTHGIQDIDQEWKKIVEKSKKK